MASAPSSPLEVAETLRLNLEEIGYRVHTCEATQSRHKEGAINVYLEANDGSGNGVACGIVIERDGFGKKAGFVWQPNGDFARRVFSDVQSVIERAILSPANAPKSKTEHERRG